MKVWLDECTPRTIKKFILDRGHECRTVQESGWAGKKNGELLSLAEVAFHVLCSQLGFRIWTSVSRIVPFPCPRHNEISTLLISFNRKCSRMSVSAAKSGFLPQPCHNSNYRNYFSLAYSACAAMRMEISGKADGISKREEGMQIQRSKT